LPNACRFQERRITNNLNCGLPKRKKTLRVWGSAGLF
jgi:hypothetical protein